MDGRKYQKVDSLSAAIRAESPVSRHSQIIASRETRGSETISAPVARPAAGDLRRRGDDEAGEQGLDDQIGHTLGPPRRSRLSGRNRDRGR